MNNRFLIVLTIKAFFVWAALSAVGFFYGQNLIQKFIPFYEVVIETLYPEYHTNVSIKPSEIEAKVVLSATALKPIPITPTQNFAAGRMIQSNITVLHTLVPLVILFTILLVIPVTSFKQRMLCITLGIPALLFVSTITAPLQLMGNLEIYFLKEAASLGEPAKASLVVNWMLLTEGGGRWLIPVLTGLGCGSLARKCFN